MIKKISSLNIILAIVYVLIYLKSGTFNSTAGILAIIVFNWLGLRSFEKEDYKWGLWHYITGLWSLYFTGTLVYGAINILSASIEFSFMSDDTLWNLILTSVFCILVCIQFSMSVFKNYRSIRN